MPRAWSVSRPCGAACSAWTSQCAHFGSPLERPTPRDGHSDAFRAAPKPVSGTLLQALSALPKETSNAPSLTFCQRSRKHSSGLRAQSIRIVVTSRTSYGSCGSCGARPFEHEGRPRHGDMRLRCFLRSSRLLTDTGTPRQSVSTRSRSFSPGSIWTSGGAFSAFPTPARNEASYVGLRESRGCC